MGEHETCPRCRSKLKFVPAGYSYATAIDGGAAPVPGHLKCRICGHYEDVEPEPAEIPSEFKSQFKPAPKNKKIVGSTVIGLVREIVRAHYVFIVNERNFGAGWPRITAALQEKHTDVELSHQAVCNAWWRIEISKREASKRKGVRKAGMSA